MYSRAGFSSIRQNTRACLVSPWVFWLDRKSLCLVVRIDCEQSLFFPLKFVKPREDIANAYARRRSQCLFAARRTQEEKIGTARSLLYEEWITLSSR